MALHYIQRDQITVAESEEGGKAQRSIIYWLELSFLVQPLGPRQPSLNIVLNY